MIAINRKIAEAFGYTKDIDNSEDILLTTEIESTLLKCRKIIDAYQGSWDETSEHYEKMKKSIWRVIELSAENHKITEIELGAIKHG